jgi:DNA-binding CsgD family transcriptional regulator
MTVKTAEVFTEKQVRAIEAQIGQNVTNAATLLILGVEGKFYKIIGDKSSAAWVARVLDGSGFAFSRKRANGETLSKRDEMIIALIKDKNTMQEIANTLGISIGTVHAVRKSEDLTPAGGTKDGAGRQSEKGAPEDNAPEDNGPAGKTDAEKAVEAFGRMANLVERLANQKDGGIDDLAMIVAHIAKVTGKTAAELGKIGAQLLDKK